MVELAFFSQLYSGFLVSLYLFLSGERGDDDDDGLLLTHNWLVVCVFLYNRVYMFGLK